MALITEESGFFNAPFHFDSSGLLPTYNSNKGMYPFNSSSSSELTSIGDKSLVVDTKVLGVLTGGIQVYVYLRSNGALVASKHSNGVGHIVFEDLAGDTDQYFVVGITDLAYNGRIFDKVTAT